LLIFDIQNILSRQQPMHALSRLSFDSNNDPGIASHLKWRMKPRPRAHGGVANLRNSDSSCCGLRLALNANPSVSSCVIPGVTRHQKRQLTAFLPA
jgi:hypothetical protein